jgi:glycosyltransferase involved in cell wall biosynthesis
VGEKATSRVILIRADGGTRDSRLQKELRMFVEAGFETVFLGWDREQAYPREEERDGFRIHRCRLRAPFASKWLFVMMPFWWLYAFRYLLRSRPDAIHACDFDTVVPALAVRLLRGTPVIYDIYDFYSVKSNTIPKPLKVFFRKAEEICARMADAVVIVDEARTYLFGARKPKEVVVAMNCPYDAVKPAWEKNPADAPFTLFYGGLITTFRGIEKLVRVTECIENVRVVMAGWITDDRYRGMLESAGHIDYIGMIDYEEALRHTYEADAVYSYYDPELEINRTANSSKMFDAFMCATPVLANAEPPSAAVVERERCGSLLPFDDDDGLRRIIALWRDDRELARAAGRNGRRLFEAELNWNRAAEKILAVYRRKGLLPG